MEPPMADEVAVLKAKLKKANANHEKLVAEWAQQGADIQKELEDTKLALGETFNELQSVREKLRRHEKKGAEAAAANLQLELKRVEESRSVREDELTAEISSLKDALRREALGKMEVWEALKVKKCRRKCPRGGVRPCLSASVLTCHAPSQEAEKLGAETAKRVGAEALAADTAVRLAESQVACRAHRERAEAAAMAAQESHQREAAASEGAAAALLSAGEAAAALRRAEDEAVATASAAEATRVALDKAEEELRCASMLQVRGVVSCSRLIALIAEPTPVTRRPPFEPAQTGSSSALRPGHGVHHQQAAGRAAVKRAERAA